MTAQIAKLPRTKAGRDMIRECHAITSIWATPPPDCSDISEVDWDELAIEVEKLFRFWIRLRTAGTNMSKAPSMPMYWDAYLADTTHLTTEEHGAYLLLLGAMWRRNGRVPDDDRDIARILGMTVAKWTRTKQRLASLLIVDGGEITQKNLQKIWENTQEKINKNRENGSKGGRPANNKNNDLAKANGSVSQNPNETIPEPEPYPEGSSDNSEIININPADAGMPAKDDRYAFSGETIRLTARDLAAWRQAYPHLSLEAELWALDPWAGEQAATGKKWFHAVSNALAKKERTMMSRIHLASVPRAMDRRLAPDPRI